MAEFRPVNVVGNYLSGRQAKQDEQANLLRQQMGQQEVEQGQRFAALSQDPNATPEQFARAGHTGVANSLTNAANAKTELDQSQKVGAAKLIVQASQHALQMPDPKAFIEQNYPQIAQLAGPAWGPATPEQVKQKLQEAIGRFGPVAGIGPEAFKGGGALYKYKDPKTGKILLGDSTKAGGNEPYLYEPASAGGSEVMTPDEVADAGLPIGTVAQRGANGKISVLSKPDAGPGSKPPTEGDKRARVMYRSMQNSEKQLEAFTSSDTSDLGQAILGKIPAGKVIQSQEYKQYEAAGLRWAANLLYLKSGATATPEEIRSTYMQFLPQPGDGKAVKKQKNEARNQELDAVNEAYSFEAPRSGNVPRPPSAAPSAQPAATPAAAPAPGGWSIKPLPTTR